MTSKSSGDFPVKLDFHCSPGERKPAEPRWVAATVAIMQARCCEGKTPRRWHGEVGGCFSWHTSRNNIFKNTSCSKRSPPVVGWAGGSRATAHALRGLHQVSRKRRRQPHGSALWEAVRRWIDALLALRRVLSCCLSPRICISGS